MVPAQEIEKEFIRIRNVVPGTEVFLNKIQEGTFLESLQSAAECAALSALYCYQKQYIIFLVALCNKKDKKKAAEIFDVLREKLGNEFFEVPVIAPRPISFFENMNSTALHIAAMDDTGHCDKDVIDILIKQGIDINHLDNNGHAALNIAMERENEVIFNALLEAGANIFPTVTPSPVGKFGQPTAPLCHMLDLTGSNRPGSIPLTPIQSRMLAKLIEMGANPNILGSERIPAFMIALCFGLGKVRDRRFDAALAKLFLSSPKIDLSVKSTFSGLDSVPMTALDYVFLVKYVRDMFPAGQPIWGVDETEGELALKDHIREKFVKRLAATEKEILDSVRTFPRVIGTLISQYECADDKFQEYGTSTASLTFLYNILEDERFKAKVGERRALLLMPPKIASV